MRARGAGAGGARPGGAGVDAGAERGGVEDDVLYVADDMVQTGATFAAFRDAVRGRWPGVRCVLLAMVWSPREQAMFE